MVDNMVWGEPHPKEGTGGVEVARHPSAGVDILTNTLRRRREEIREMIHEAIRLWISANFLTIQLLGNTTCKNRGLQNWTVERPGNEAAFKLYCFVSPSALLPGGSRQSRCTCGQCPTLCPRRPVGASAGP